MEKNTDLYNISSAVFDDVATKILDSFKGILRDKGDVERYLRKRNHTVHQQLQCKAIQPYKRSVRLENRGGILHEIATQLKETLLAISAINLYSLRLNLMEAKPNRSQNCFKRNCLLETAALKHDNTIKTYFVYL